MQDAEGQRPEASSRGEGTTLSIIRGRSSRAVFASTLRNLKRAPVYARSFLRRRNRQLWVFGNLHGFRDSPRYLAEHVLHEQPRLRPVWIARSDEEAALASAAGLAVARDGEPDGTRMQRDAGVAFFSHGFKDLDLALVDRAYLVWLWHGKSLKRVGLDVSVAQAQRRPLTVRSVARVVRWFQRRAYRLIKLYVASSEHDKLRFITAFHAPPERIGVLGSPRFDVIRGGPEYERAAGPGDLRERLGYSASDYIVLWLPTHRAEYGGDRSWVPVLTREMLDESLGDSNIRLLVKTHPIAQIDVYRERLPDDPRVKLLDESEVDANCLLHIADALISDYSSAAFDYAILNRPIHFLAPDLATFSDRRGLYEPYETLSDGQHHERWETLLADLSSSLDAGPGTVSIGAQNAQRVREFCGHNLEPEACRRIVATIASAAHADVA